MSVVYFRCSDVYDIWSALARGSLELCISVELKTHQRLDLIESATEGKLLA